MGDRQERQQRLAHGDGSGAGTAGAVRPGERLVDVVVHHVHAEVAGPRDAEDGVHIGAVEVDQGALAMYQIGNLRDLVIEDAERIWVGNHENGGASVELGREIGEIDEAAVVALDAHGVEAGNGRAGGIGAVSAVGDENTAALFAAVAEVSGGDQQRGQFALRTRRRL